MEHHQFAFRIAEDENIAVAKMGLFDRFFEGHGPQGDGVLGVHEVDFGGPGDCWKFVNRD